MISVKKFAYSLSLAALLGSVVACGAATDTADTTAEGGGEETAAATDGGSELEGSITVDGSSTVFPVSEAMAEEFQLANPGVRITVGASGTGGGFEKFCAGETQISNASRGVEQEEIDNCAENGIEMIEVPVATDALSVVVNNDNDWAVCMTLEQLNTMWGPEAEGTITNWNQVDPSFPDAELILYGPGTDSGTFDYFTEVVNGEGGASRGDYTSSEDDNVLVQGVEGDTNALAYFGFAYYFENQDRMKSVAIDDGSGNCVSPSPETVLAGEYTPFSRPLFIYVNATAYEEDPAVQAFVDFYLDPANEQFVADTGYVPLSGDLYEASLAAVKGGEIKSTAE
ncbi:PstS family phosphate ABC transporter substrate-binding protein [Halomicronema sp. CCY15110]|uniref:PstS family phosphate ABC transporter substrate-binding protein n=1 Tax=Halomicronema sp. CCY15110 TaxID=2767773 RepID=UPI00195058D4|nr:PstS family phosphate ABC transporter substrate-binding protein [Halomicronema sp. CCY15110]